MPGMSSSSRMPSTPPTACDLGVHPGDVGIGQHLQDLGCAVRLAFQRHHELGDAEQPARHRVRPRAATMRIAAPSAFNRRCATR